MATEHDELLGALWRAADVSRARVGAVAEQQGITFQQYMVLRVLASAGGDGLPTLEIAARLVERAPGITGLLDRLERRGVVRRDRGDRDRRQVRCALTDEGRVLVSRLAEDAAIAARQSVSMLTNHELGVLRHLAQRMIRQDNLLVDKLHIVKISYQPPRPERSEGPATPDSEPAQ
ncbi:MAG TPA: MarR family winged helix-turn-helix transcriptional regulator [Gemmatimonadales bacterium]|nr:MarR family winged helix-turn-helix transcriptional regulator [Gemmatimonadales bacterium]